MVSGMTGKMCFHLLSEAEDIELTPQFVQTVNTQTFLVLAVTVFKLLSRKADFTTLAQ